MHYCHPQSNFRGGRVPRVPRGIYATDQPGRPPLQAPQEESTAEHAGWARPHRFWWQSNFWEGRAPRSLPGHM